MKYEISIWEDVFENNTLVEKRIAIIGSDLMTSFNRVQNPKLVQDVNGVNTFTFDLYDNYIDVRTGVYCKNPYVKYLVNERKIKVFWKNQWYDLLVKNIDENSEENKYSYTCKDMYLTELSRTGFNLEFATELQNNIGTAQYLVSKVIENTDWSLSEDSDILYQLLDEPVYEVTLLNELTSCTKLPEKTRQYNIPTSSTILIFYSYAQGLDSLKDTIQFYYSPNSYIVDDNMIVTNGYNYNKTIHWEIDEVNNIATAYDNDIIIFEINFNNTLSTRYRAQSYVDSQKTEYNELLNRYVNVFTNGNKEYYGYETTEYNDVLSVVNLVTSFSNFTMSDGTIAGWHNANDVLNCVLYPPFDQYTDLSTYNPTSFLRLDSNTAYFNSGIQNNRIYIKNGFSEGDIYYCRFKLQTDNENMPSGNYYKDSGVRPKICGRTLKYEPTETEYFSIVEASITQEDNWVTFKMRCEIPCAYENLIDSSNPFGIFLINITDNVYWLEEVQFFKEVIINDKIIEPNGVVTESVAKLVWKYFDKNTQAATADEIEYIDGSSLIPIYNNYEKFGSIVINQSNRFNILQSIAETFECWIIFDIQHDENGYILKDENGFYQKRIKIKKDRGVETGIGFVYGIDLKSITRNIVSDEIATKTIVLSNNNQFGQNGFCTIARSQQNYAKENFILNFDYYIQHQLLSRDTLYNDLYGQDGFYSTLHELNTVYAINAEDLINKKADLTKANSQYTIFTQYLEAAHTERSRILNNLATLAGITETDLTDDELIILINEYLSDHYDNTKVKALLNNYGYVTNNINSYTAKLESLSLGLTELNEKINILNTAQSEIISNLTAVHSAFYKKYSRYIQEGTWNSDDYYNDDLYYLDGLRVSYTSSKPQITYNISVIRLSELEEYSSKIFNLGDISFIQDVHYFGYAEDGITPYKEKVIISEITSYFDSPEKDVIKVQNYKTQFDDLFQRVTTATQTLEYSQGKYTNVANILNTDGTIKSNVIQNSFNANTQIVYNAQNENITFDDTGITVSNADQRQQKVKITSGGIFVTNNNGESWNNAIKGDGITTDLLTAGAINTNDIFIYNEFAPTFRWDSTGISAYKITNDGVNQDQFVRFDQFGLYGVNNSSGNNFLPTTIQDVEDNASFGLTWDKFFIKSDNEIGITEISTDHDIVIKTDNGLGDYVDRITIGRLDNPDILDISDYGIVIKDYDGNEIFRCDSSHSGMVGGTIGGWFISNSEIYTTYDKTATGQVKTRLSTNGIKIDNNYYSIVSDAASIGGLKIINGQINGYDLSDFARRIAALEAIIEE